jgi:hypothetical protein
MQIAAILFGLAALGGLVMVGIRASKNQNPPTALALGHGLIAAAGLITLIYHRLTATSPPMPNEVNWAIGIFVVAALGGIGMFTLFHLRNRVIPLAFMLVHGLIAAVGLGLLLWAMYGK